MSANSINVDGKKFKESDLFNKYKKMFSINNIDVNKILVYKKDMVNIIHLNTLLVIMIIMLLNHCFRAYTNDLLY